MKDAVTQGLQVEREDQKAVVEVHNLTKDFGDGAGVFNISFNLQPGEIVGFIGPNGAGKTTTMSCILGFLQRNQGIVKIFDTEVSPQSVYKIMPDIGLLMSDIEFESYLTPKQIIKRAISVKKNIDKVYVDSLVLDLDIQMNKRYGKLSLGNKRKLGVLIAVINKPKLLIFDEPTSGLDPLIQRKFLEVIRKLADEGSTILLSSHVLSEVQTICDRVLMIKAGKLVFEGTVKDIVESSPKIFRFVEYSPEFAALLKQQAFTTEIQQDQNALLCFTQNPESALKFMIEQGQFQFYLERPSLEELFINSY
jgi:ABC-2 type transport system ATP-binding protein